MSGLTTATMLDLLGRYDRCEAGGTPVLEDEMISRVHALVVEVDGRPLIVDLGSVNGLWSGDTRVRVHELRRGEEIGLGRNSVRVRWEPVS